MAKTIKNKPVHYQDYARPAGVCYLYAKTSLPWMGAGSADAQELFDPLLETGHLGFPSYSGAADPLTGYQIPDIAFVKGRYMAMMPTALAEDAALADWPANSSDGAAIDGGTWEQHRTYGPPPSQRICQVDSDANVHFARHSAFQHAANASFAIRIDLGDVDQNADPAQGTRFAAVVWGGRAWGIWFYSGHAPVLVESVGGEWTPRVELPGLTRGTDDNPGEAVIIVELIRNSVVVTTEYSPDLGSPVPIDSAELLERFHDKDQHQGFYSRDEDSALGPVGWNSGVFDVFGVGLELAIEVTPVAYPAEASYISTFAALINPRGDSPAIDTWGNANGGTVNVSLLNGAFDSFLRYRLDFFPAFQQIGARIWMRTPDVEAVRIFYPCLTLAPIYGDDGGETLEGRILSCKLTKPAQLDQVTFTATLYFPDGFHFASGDWRWRPIQVALGWEFAAGQAGRSAGVELVPVFTGYIVEAQATQLDPFTVDVVLTCVSGSIRARKKRFGTTVAPRGGLTLNQALSIWMQSMGIDGSGYAWDPLGDLIVLPRGRSEKPAFKPPVDGDSWGWHQELCKCFGLDLVWTDDGLFMTVPVDLVIPFPDTWYGLPQNPLNGIQSLTVRESVLDTYSRLIVSGHVPRLKDGLERSEPDSWRYVYSAWAINYAAEQDPFYTGFRPWSEVRQKPLDFGPLTPDFIDFACYNQAERELFPRQYVQLHGEFSPFIGRRYQVNVVANGPEATGVYVCESIEHELTGKEFEAHTTITAYRIE